MTEWPLCGVGEPFALAAAGVKAAMRAVLIPRFDGRELPGKDHSVLTIHFVNRPEHPTCAAREQVMAFLQDRLKNGAA